ncbi:MAG: amidase [Actinomycetota bacterium]|nr:amidase [Actinomycetota bacterium]
MNDELSALDATAQAELVRRGEVRPVELVEAAISRIERLNPVLQAVITPLFEEARAQALSPELPDGPFRGVPFLLKDWFCHTADDPYYEGMPVLRELGWREQTDTYLATKFRAAGLVFLGKTNIGSYTRSRTPAFPTTRNPWDPERPPAGSSGGSAAAVASGMVPAAHGNDGTGSLRIPASACGLVGLKASRGRISFGPPGPTRSPGLLGHIIEGVLTRSVHDTAAFLDVMAGPMPGDLWGAPPPTRPYWDEVGAAPGRLRVGLLTRDLILDAPVGDDCVRVVREVGELLESLGHVVEEDAYPLALTGPTGLGEALCIVTASGTAATLDAWAERIGRPLAPEDVDSGTWARAELSRSYDAVQVQAAVRRLESGVMRAPEWWASGYDLLVTPTVQQPTPRFEDLTEDRVGSVFGLFTMPWSITGQPAISLPLGRSTDELPIGVQLVADYAREDLLIRVASQLEEARPWSGLVPPIHA